jgi:ribosome-associated heat shock protein Hsp15
MNDAADTARLDVWLWRARFFKTRTRATAFVARRRVRLTRDGTTRRIEKPASDVAPGDILTFALRGRAVSVRVLGIGTRRGPAAEARGLYESAGPAQDRAGSGENGEHAERAEETSWP